MSFLLNEQNQLQVTALPLTNHRRSCPIMKSPWCFLSVTLLQEKVSIRCLQERLKLSSLGGGREEVIIQKVKRFKNFMTKTQFLLEKTRLREPAMRGPGSQLPHSGSQVHLTFGPFRVCCSHSFRETNSLRRTMQIVEGSLLHWRAQGSVSS